MKKIHEKKTHRSKHMNLNMNGLDNWNLEYLHHRTCVRMEIEKERTYLSCVGACVCVCVDVSGQRKMDDGTDITSLPDYYRKEFGSIDECFLSTVVVIV